MIAWWQHLSWSGAALVATMVFLSGSLLYLYFTDESR